MDICRRYLSMLGLYACLLAGGLVGSSHSEAMNFPQLLHERLSHRQAPTLLALEPDSFGMFHNRSVGSIEVVSDTRVLRTDFLFYETTSVRADGSPPPVILLYSGLAGIGILERTLARYFARQGVNVIVSHYFNEEQAYDMSLNNREALDALLTSFALADWAQQRQGLVPVKLNVLGISYGGIRGLFHSLLDPRISGAILMVAGGSLPEIMAYSELPRVAAIREHQMNEAGLSSPDDYYQLLESQLELRLEDYAHLRKPEDFYLFISKNDTWVPSHSQWKVWEALGRPQHEAYALGHIKAPAYASFLRRSAMKQFFWSRWGEDLSPEAPTEAPSEAPYPELNNPLFEPW